MFTRRALAPDDERLLREILTAGHALEQLWPTETADQALDRSLMVRLSDLKSLMRSCAASSNPDVSRLAGSADHLSEQMTARHLSNFLIPFERLMGRALRDDEFLVTEDDRAPIKRRATAPLVVIADHLRSAFNVGAILRTAEGFGVEEVILSGYTPGPDQERTAKTSMGAEAYVPWRRVGSASDAIADMKSKGYAVVAVETSERAIDLHEFVWPAKAVVLLGNERFGLDHAALSQADHVVKIPMYGVKNSLNVGIAFGIVAAHWRSGLQQLKAGLWPLSAIGVYRSSARFPFEARRQGSLDQSGEVGLIELARGRGFEQTLDGLAGFERAWLLSRFHHNPNWKPMVMPPRGPRVKRGVFATRSPHRPNSLGLTAVEIVEVSGLKVYVKGCDLLDGTPILDIKPYLPYADAFPESRAGWVDELNVQRFEIMWTSEAACDLSWLETNGLLQLRGFIHAQLEFDPLDDSRKRVTIIDSADLAIIAYRTWRVRFEVSAEDQRVRVLGVFSGYSEAELKSSEDPYQDKDLHRRFVARNQSELD